MNQVNPIPLPQEEPALVITSRGVEMGAIVVDDQAAAASADSRPDTAPSPGGNRERRVSIEESRIEHLVQLPPAKTPYQKALSKLEALVENQYTTALMSLFTLWALFGTDIKHAATYKNADQAFLVIISIIFFFFLGELVAVSLYKPDYLRIPKFQRRANESTIAQFIRIISGFGSFYFWLDLIATVSLIFEITWILPSLGTQYGKSSSKAGTRAARLVRIVRMVRLVRIVKLYKYATKKSEVSASAGESHVGAAMSDLTNRRVIVLILSLLIIIPLLTISTDDTAPIIITSVLHSAAKNYFTNPTDESKGLLDVVVESAKSHSKVISMNFNGVIYWQDADALNKYRRGIETIELSVGSKFPTTIIFDTYEHSVNSSTNSIGTTIFVMFLLTAGAVYMSRDVSNLVITPIERMVALVKQISQNPLGVAYEMLGDDDGFVQGMETTILLSTITKIGRLMKVGFGEAGASVISKSLRDGTGGQLNLMGGGEMITSIFGFCDVRQFTDTTECLQEEVMLFVNRIAHILHGIVAQCSGSANKNIGDAFLLTWKINRDETPAEISRLADQALLAFCKTMIELVRYEEFICNFSVAATQRLYKRFNDYHVRIGSGLHVGWAVEGAIGSNRKIDASYLSPHVNFTEYLESSTKAYGVPLLMSEQFWKLLSPAAQKFTRQVDRVRRSRGEDPLGLYTYDADLLLDFADPNRKRPRDAAPVGAGRGLSTLRLAAMKVVQERRTSVSPAAAAQPVDTTDSAAAAPKHDVEQPGASKRFGRSDVAPDIIVAPYEESVWETDIDVVDLRHRVNDVFRAIWAEGMTAYINGGQDWQKARDKFQETMRMSRGRDGPSKFIISVIDQYGGSCPHDWQGFRNDGDGGH